MVCVLATKGGEVYLDTVVCVDVQVACADVLAYVEVVAYVGVVVYVDGNGCEVSNGQVLDGLSI